MAKHKKELNKKLATQTLRAGTQNAAVQEDDKDTKYVTSISLETDGMLSRKELLKSVGYQGMTIPLGDAESNGKYKGILNRIGKTCTSQVGQPEIVPRQLCNLLFGIR